VLITPNVQIHALDQWTGVTLTLLLPRRHDYQLGRQHIASPDAGIDVEVVVPAEAAGPRIAAVDELSPQQLFTLYADQQGLAPEAAAIGCEQTVLHAVCCTPCSAGAAGDERDPNVDLCIATALLVSSVLTTNSRRCSDCTASIFEHPWLRMMFHRESPGDCP